MQASDKIRAIVGRLTRRAADTVNMDSWPTQYGLDSLSLLIFREQCEAEFKVHISDDAWSGMSCLSDVVAFVDRHDGERARTAAGIDAGGPSESAPAVPCNEDDFVERLEIGMPLMGINHLSECALLKYLGDLRWRHVTRISGVSSKLLADATGNRLYPAFFYVESAFPADRPMASHGENDVLCVVDSMRRYGHSMLDGFSYLITDVQRETFAAPLKGPAHAAALGIPSIRMSNVFVMQFSGADWLKKGRPADGLIEGIHELQEAPECYGIGKRAEQAGYIDLPDPSYTPLHNAPVEYEYKVQPDRDVNGVGLLYFANYTIFLDLAEREALKNTRYPLSDDLINKRTIVNRKVAYLNNASWKDAMKIKSRSWIKIEATDGGGSDNCCRLFTNHLMHRVSDGRLMCVCSVSKILFGVTVEMLKESQPALAMSLLDN